MWGWTRKQEFVPFEDVCSPDTDHATRGVSALTNALDDLTMRSPLQPRRLNQTPDLGASAKKQPGTPASATKYEAPYGSCADEGLLFDEAPASAAFVSEKRVAIEKGDGDVGITCINHKVGVVVTGLVPGGQA